jgi:hypothetical protein
MTDVMGEPRRLVDLEAIKHLKARYCLLLDAQDWGGLRARLTDDCRLDLASGRHSSPDAFVDRMRETVAGQAQVHFAAMPIIEFTGPNSARGLWMFSDRDTYGHYQEEYRREDGVWKIESSVQTWMHEASDELRASRKGRFDPARWHALVADWARPGS